MVAFREVGLKTVRSFTVFKPSFHRSTLYNYRCWFKVLPAQKGKLEGQRVHVDDKILLFNIAQRRYLRQSRSMDENGHYEVDLFVFCALYLFSTM